MIKKLEKSRIIKEYTMIPDFSKLGLELLSITFAKRHHEVSREELAKIEREGADVARKQGIRTIMALRGMGLGYDVAIVALHPNYSAYTEVVQAVQDFPHSDVSRIESFLINLTDRVQYRPLTLSHIATYLSDLADKRGK
jgi:DNA-binding Lrp family transcriptional regulator